MSDLNQSPFNVGHKLYLDDFNEQQLKQLNQLYDSPLHEADLSDAMELFQGHPYLTSIALYTLKKEGLSWATLKSRATVEEGPFAEHLHYLHRLLNREPELQQALKQIINHERCTEEQALFRLLKAGLIKDQGATYVCRCALYRQYFVEKL